jgi:hypothetical protein
MDQPRPAPTFGQRWTAARPTKTAAAWYCVASIVGTLLLGFTWGGWVTGGTARAMAAAAGEETLVKRLTPICVIQFRSDPKKSEKLKTLQALDSWRQSDYVQEQGWATMPGEQHPESRIAVECARLVAAMAG